LAKIENKSSQDYIDLEGEIAELTQDRDRNQSDLDQATLDMD